MVLYLDQLLSRIAPKYDDDFADRLNYYYTGLILVILSMTLSAKQYYYQAIQCWMPAEFKGAWEQYAENYCFVENTYYLPMDQDIPNSLATRQNKEIGYYQWVPFVLALMALMFYAPAAFWRIFNWQSGVNVGSIVSTCLKLNNVDEDKRKGNAAEVSLHLHDAFGMQHDLKGTPLKHGKKFGSYIVVVYLITKLLYVGNVVGQFFLLNSFLGFPNYSLWGYGVLNDLANGREWQQSGIFPRVTLCDFQVRDMAQNKHHTIQCVLIVNMFNEKIFLFLWWWFCLVAFAGILSLFKWLYLIISTPSQVSLVRSHLLVNGTIDDSPNSEAMVKMFVSQMMRPDGMLMLRLIAANAGDIITTDLIVKMFEDFRKAKAEQIASRGPPTLRYPDEKSSDPGLIENLPYLRQNIPPPPNMIFLIAMGILYLDTLTTKIQPRYDDDAVDRANYYWSGLILIIISVLTTGSQYVGNPIQCWVPAQFTGAWEGYTEKYCFVQNTYFLPLDETVPKSYSERDQREIGYYQWVPFILALEALMFYLPCLLWRMLNWQSGINVKAIIGMAVDAGNIDVDKRHNNAHTVSQHLWDALELQKDMKGGGRLCGFLMYGKRYGSYITGLYVVTKLLYVVNVVGQFFLLNKFLGFPDYNFWGFQVLSDLATGKQWEQSGHFPRVTMCDFEVRVLGNLHHHTVQCVLQVNMFNEKIFLFLWWWFFGLAIVTILNFFYWIFITISTGSYTGFVEKYIRITSGRMDRDVRVDQMALDRFVRRNLRPDGVFLLRIIESSAGDILTADLIYNLYMKFAEAEKQRSLAEPVGEFNPLKPPVPPKPNAPPPVNV